MISSSKCSQRQPHLRWMCSIVVLYFALFYSDAQTVTTVNPIVIKRDSNDFVTSIPWEVNSDTKIEFSVTPSDCVISPDPSQEATIGYNSIGGKFFTVTCPDPIAKATINFTPNRGDRQIVVDGDVTSRSAERNVTSIILSKKQTSVSNPYIQLRELHLCNNMTSTALCKDFQINVGFSHVFPPVLTQIRVLKAPTSFKLPHFTPGCEAYQIKLFQNVPVTFVLQSDPNHRIFVDSNPSVPNVSKGFISSTQFLNFRPRVEPGMTENVTVYAATYDRSLSRSYTIMVTTVQSSESHLASLSVSPGRLEPEFSPYVFSYFARVPEGHEKFTIQLSGLDDVHTVCVFNHDKPIVVTGQGEATVYLPSGTQPGSHTVVITCTSQDQSSQIRYTLILVPNKGGSTLLKDLDIIGGELDRPFDPLNHGPYLANLELQGRQDQGWISFVGHASNPRATVTVEYVPFDKTSGTSPWFRIERGELRRFRIAVRTPENPVEEEYFVHVDRRGKWYEASSWTRKMADLFGWTSVVASMGRYVKTEYILRV